MDSGGHHTQAVYKFCQGRVRRRVYAIKGMAGPGRPVWPKRRAKNAAGRAALFMVGVDAAKQEVFAHFRLTTAGPGFCHFPTGRDERYFSGLALETMRTRHSKGFPVLEFVRRSGARNEPLDCRVYAYAALCSLNIIWARIAARANAQRQALAAHEQEDAPADVAAQPPQPARGRLRRVGNLGRR